MRNAKIVCTLGPASTAESVIESLAEAGMSVARVNASHGTDEKRSTIIERVQAIDDRTDEPLAMMYDLQGPEIRTAPVDDPVALQAGTSIRFDEGSTADQDRIGLTYPLTGISPGDRVLLDDGRIETRVERLENGEVIARVENDGLLESRRGVNVPGVELELPVPTPTDRDDIAQAVEAGVDLIAASFVRNAGDVYRVEEAIEAQGAEIPVIAKIEREVAVGNLDAIVDAAFGVMVARGDLGVECPMEDVPMIQKRVIRHCRETGTPVITATEMLDSMVQSRRPTRAEASDVANAVLDGTDALMLSAETAVGDQPIAVVEAMDRIIREVEQSAEYAELREQRVPPAGDVRTEALARSARYLARDVGASAVIAVSESGYTVRKSAKFRPGVPIVAATPKDTVRRKLAVVSGVTARHVPATTGGPEAAMEAAVEAALEAGIAESGDTVVVLSGMMTGRDEPDTTDMLKVHVAAETLATGRGAVAGRATGQIAISRTGDLSSVPAGAILVVPASFDAEFDGDPRRLAGLISGASGVTGYPAMVAREIGIPMVSAVEIEELQHAGVVTIDGERGVIYDGDVTRSPGKTVE